MNSKTSLFAGLLLCIVGISAGTAMSAPLAVTQVAELSGQSTSAENILGARLYLDHINRTNAIGHTIELKQFDDKRDAKLTVQLTRASMERDRPVALFGYRATSSIEALIDAVPDMPPLVAPANGITSLRERSSNAFFMRATYGDEARKLVQHFATLGMTRVGLVYQGDSFGKSVLADVQGALVARNLKLAASWAYDRATMDVRGAVEGVVTTLPQAVIMACTSRACVEVIRGIRATNASVVLAVLSPATNAEFFGALGPAGAGILMTQVVPYPWSQATPVVTEFNRLNAAAGARVPVSYDTLEGFMAAKLLVEGIRRAGPQPTAASLAAALRSMRSVDLGGHHFESGRKGGGFVDIVMLDRRGKVLR